MCNLQELFRNKVSWSCNTAKNSWNVISRFKNYIHNYALWVTWIKLLLATCDSSIPLRIPVLISAARFLSSVLLTHGKATEDALSTRVPATHMWDMDGIPSSWLQSVAAFWGAHQWVEAPFLIPVEFQCHRHCHSFTFYVKFRP